MLCIVIATVLFYFLDKFQWSCPEWKGIPGRYEHSAFIPDCSPKKVYVFGGAQQATNLNDIQALDLGTVVYKFFYLPRHGWKSNLATQWCSGCQKRLLIIRLGGEGKGVSIPSPGS